MHSTGYTDVVKHPMDFRTITTKVARGKYRSLDDFAVRCLLLPHTFFIKHHLTHTVLTTHQADVRLVTTNAKLFNPPGSIHYTEAERIESYGLSHIAKASQTVIQYEADWNIDIEADDDDAQGSSSMHQQADANDLEDDQPMEDVRETRSPSPGFTVDGVMPPRRARGGPGRSLRQVPPTTVKKDGDKTKVVPTISESLDENGHLPGAKEGVGVFEPGSDLARVMLEIKLKSTFYLLLFFWL